MKDPIRPFSVDGSSSHGSSGGEREFQQSSSEKLAQSALAQMSDSNRSHSGKAIGLVVAISLLFALGIPAFIFGPMVVDMVKMSQLRESGTPATAEILSVKETNTWFNNERVIALQLRVAPDGRPPYEASVEQPFSLLHGGNLRSGAGVAVKFDPKQPELLVVTQTGVALPQAAQALSIKDPVCAATARCCLIVSGDAARSACEAFTTGNVPPVSCARALDSYVTAAKALGRSCE